MWFSLRMSTRGRFIPQSRWHALLSLVLRRSHFRESSLLRRADERSPRFSSQLTLAFLHQLSACPPSHCSYGSVLMVANVVHSPSRSRCAGTNSPHSKYCFCPL